MSNATGQTNPLSKSDISLLYTTGDKMPAVLEIERSSFQEPWKEDEFILKLRQRNPLCIGMTAESGAKVVGFCIYELMRNHVRLINIAVHPDYRGQGIGEQFILKLRSKLTSQLRTHIVALVPASCLEKTQGFFKKYAPYLSVRSTEHKGQVTHKPVFSALTARDFEEVQLIEDAVLDRAGREPRHIEELVTKGSRYGIVARDNISNDVMGYVLYERDSKGISLNGEFGVIVDREFRRQGIGRALMQELVKQKLPITLHNVCLTCKDQVGFLKAIGVPVPELQRSVNVEWRPEEAKKQ